MRIRTPEPLKCSIRRAEAFLEDLFRWIHTVLKFRICLHKSIPMDLKLQLMGPSTQHQLIARMLRPTGNKGHTVDSGLGAGGLGNMNASRMRVNSSLGTWGIVIFVSGIIDGTFEALLSI